jgi:hypothetical protein
MHIFIFAAPKKTAEHQANFYKFFFSTALINIVGRQGRGLETFSIFSAAPQIKPFSPSEFF